MLDFLWGIFLLAFSHFWLSTWNCYFSKWLLEPHFRSTSFKLTHQPQQVESKARRWNTWFPAHQLNIVGIVGFLLGCSISTSPNPIFLSPDKSISLLAGEWHSVKAFQGLPINSCNEEVVVAVFLMMGKVGLLSICSAAIHVLEAASVFLVLTN